MDAFKAGYFVGTPAGESIIPIAPDERASLRFTFFWPDAARWEGRRCEIEVVEP